VQTVEFYDRWVNGTGLHFVELASGKAPKQAPVPSPSPSTADTPKTVISLEPYEGCKPQLPQLDAQAATPVSRVLVHGSMATQDACPFSDVDIAVIVDDCTEYTLEQHASAVRELRRLLHAALEYDALMHHGLMFFPLSGLQRYDQRFLPIETLRCARVLHGDPSLELHSGPEAKQHFADSLRRCAAALLQHLHDESYLRDDYRLKSFLSGALLMPARVLAAKGTHVYKRDSFDLARELFDRADWEFIARCEGMRCFWKRPPEPLARRCVPQKSHPRLLQIAGERVAPHMNSRRLSKAMIHGMATSAERFFGRLEAIA
jgi:predicted nucleotidyltransferase